MLDQRAVDLAPPAAPSGLAVTAKANAQVSPGLDSVRGGRLQRLPQPAQRRRLGEGQQRARVTGTTFTDTGLNNAAHYYYIVRALDAAGNESAASNEVSALPHCTIGWANLQWPPTMTHTISAVNRTDNVYGQVWIDGVTSQPGADAGAARPTGLRPRWQQPGRQPGWTWVEAALQRGRGQQRRVCGQPAAGDDGTFDYAYRYTTTNGRDWLYADLDGIAQRLQPRPGGQPDRQLQRRHHRAGRAHRARVVVGARRRRSSWPGMRSPATHRSTATRCAAQDAPAALTPRSPVVTGARATRTRP